MLNVIYLVQIYGNELLEVDYIRLTTRPDTLHLLIFDKTDLVIDNIPNTSQSANTKPSRFKILLPSRLPPTLPLVLHFTVQFYMLWNGPSDPKDYESGFQSVFQMINCSDFLNTLKKRLSEAPSSRVKIDIRVEIRPHSVTWSSALGLKASGNIEQFSRFSEHYLTGRFNRLTQDGRIGRLSFNVAVETYMSRGAYPFFS